MIKNILGIIISFIVGGTILNIINNIDTLDINGLNSYYQFLFLFVILILGLSMITSVFSFTFFLVNFFINIIKKGIEFYDH
jgi:uncharacterized membrane protein